MILELLYVSGKLPTYPSPQPNINSNFSIRAKCCLRGGVGGQFPRYDCLFLSVCLYDDGYYMYTMSAGTRLHRAHTICCWLWNVRRMFYFAYRYYHLWFSRTWKATTSLRNSVWGCITSYYIWTTPGRYVWSFFCKGVSIGEALGLWCYWFNSLNFILSRTYLMTNVGSTEPE